jgi:hypothetical protein
MISIEAVMNPRGETAAHGSVLRIRPLMAGPSRYGHMTYVTSLKRGRLEAPRDRNLSFDVSRRLALPKSIDNGNLRLHKGHRLVAFA